MCRSPVAAGFWIVNGEAETTSSTSVAVHESVARNFGPHARSGGCRMCTKTDIRRQLCSVREITTVLAPGSNVYDAILMLPTAVASTGVPSRESDVKWHPCARTSRDVRLGSGCVPKRTSVDSSEFIYALTPEVQSVLSRSSREYFTRNIRVALSDHLRDFRSSDGAGPPPGRMNGRNSDARQHISMNCDAASVQSSIARSFGPAAAPRTSR